MRIGIGLPTQVGALRKTFIRDFAREAERAGLHSLWTIDRIAFDSLDPFVSLSTAATVTEHIRLGTGILIVPPRISGSIIAK